MWGFIKSTANNKINEGIEITTKIKAGIIVQIISREVLWITLFLKE